MRTAGNSFLPKKVLAGIETAFLVALGVCFLSPASFAADPTIPSVAAPVLPPRASAPVATASTVATPAFVAPSAPGVAPTPVAAQVPAAPGTIPATFQVPEAPKAQGQGDDIAKALSAMEEKATESAKNVVKRLDTTEATNMQDLNVARQTVTRIEAMIDVEKRLGELEKLRGDRTARSMAASMALPAGFAGAIPASALQPLPRPNAAVARAESSGFGEQPVMHFGGGRSEILRISGTEGKYVAVLKSPDGEKKSVKVGDKVAGGTVRAITSTSVEVGGKGTSDTLRIKNVDAIYSAMR